MANEEDAQRVENQASTAKGGTYTFSFSSIVVQLLLASSLYYVWGMVEGLQIVDSIGLIHAKVPGNTSSFLESVSELSSFNFIDVSSMREGLLYLPESDAFSLTFQSEGYDNIYVISLLEAQFFYIMFIWTVLAVDMILLALTYKWPKIQTFRQKYTIKYLYWNGLVRFFMEIYLFLAMFSFINLANMDWDTSLPAVNFSNFCAIVGTILVIVGPIILIVFTMRKFKDLSNEEFQKRHGVMVEGLELNYRERSDVPSEEVNRLQRIVVLVGGFHFVRRFLLCISVVCAPESTFFQISL